MKLSLLLLSVCLVSLFQLKGEEATPTPPAQAASKVIDSSNVEDLKANANQTVTVKGKVVKATDWDGKGNPEKGINFIDLAGKQFTLVVFAADYGKFTSHPAVMYKDKTIEVTGKLELRKEKWQIKATSPEQVKIVEDAAEPAAPAEPKEK
jgi:RecJ-like exonuclease